MHNHINRNVRHYDKNHKKVWCLATTQDLPFDQIIKLRSSLSPTAESPKGEPQDPQDQILTKWSPSYDQNLDESTDQPRPILQDTIAQQSISDHDCYLTESNDDDIDPLTHPPRNVTMSATPVTPAMSGLVQVIQTTHSTSFQINALTLLNKRKLYPPIGLVSVKVHKASKLHKTDKIRKVHTV